jgi:hypothetical protein
MNGWRYWVLKTDLGNFNECARQVLARWWDLCREQNLITDTS